ncbi:lipoyl synthase [bacterium]|nr:lipoyl synthase [bacterium]
MYLIKIKQHNPNTTLEVLTGDFSGSLESIEKIIAAKPHVFSHNLETVERITPNIRDPRATYEQSLMQLKRVKAADSGIFTKSSLMLGLGEEDDEIVQALKDMRTHNVDFVTLGQYLQPSQSHAPVKRYVPPEQFDYFKDIAYDLGFKMVASGPLVRSSYKAGEFFIKEYINKQKNATL